MTERLKWCTGTCGRELPLSMFRRGGRGGLNGRCRVCQRWTARLWYRKHYRTDPAFRAREVARCSANTRAKWAAAHRRVRAA